MFRARRITTVVAVAALAGTAAVVAPATASIPAEAASTNACSNPVLATNLAGWGALDGKAVSRDSVGDRPGASWAFDTSGRSFYQPQLAVVAGQTWTVSAMDRVLNASGTATMGVDWYNAAGTYLSSSSGKAVALPKSTLSGGTWTKVSATVTAPSTATVAHVLQTGSFGSATGTAFKATQCDYEKVATTPSGVAMPVGDLPADAQGPSGWKQTFTDDFTTAGTATSSGALPDGKWWGYDAGTTITNSTNGIYDSSKTVSVSGGVLRYHLYSTGGKAYAAVESPLPSSGQQYGRYDVQYRYESGSNVAGFKSVWMLWPTSDRWGQGEEDFAEYDNAAGRTSVSANLHRACGDDVNGCAQDSGSVSLDPTQWHTATVIWSPGKVTALSDGHLVATSTTQTPTATMRLLLQTEASDYGPQAAPSAVVNIDVDWVVGYTRK